MDWDGIGWNELFAREPKVAISPSNIDESYSNYFLKPAEAKNKYFFILICTLYISKPYKKYN